MISIPSSLHPGAHSGKPLAIKLICILLTTFLISNCGWHLRGYSDNAQTIESIYISGTNSKSELLRELERSLLAMDIAIKEKASEAEYSLIISGERSKQRTATVSGSARISELELTETANFRVFSNNESEALPLATVRVERVFEYNEDNILATDDEARLLRSEMKRDLARQILNRLQSLGRVNTNATTP